MREKEKMKKKVKIHTGYGTRKLFPKNIGKKERVLIPPVFYKQQSKESEVSEVSTIASVTPGGAPMGKQSRALVVGSMV